MGIEEELSEVFDEMNDFKIIYKCKHTFLKIPEGSI